MQDIALILSTIERLSTIPSCLQRATALYNTTLVQLAYARCALFRVITSDHNCALLKQPATLLVHSPPPSGSSGHSHSFAKAPPDSGSRIFSSMVEPVELGETSGSFVALACGSSVRGRSGGTFTVCPTNSSVQMALDRRKARSSPPIRCTTHARGT